MTSMQIPLPAAGSLEPVAETSETVFNWGYALDREALVLLGGAESGGLSDRPA